MELKIPVKKENNIKAKLKLLNCFLNNLTEVELDIIATMINMGYNTLGRESDARADVRKHLKMTKYNFNNYTKRLTDKHILYINQDKVVTLNPKVLELTRDNVISIEFQTYAE